MKYIVRDNQINIFTYALFDLQNGPTLNSTSEAAGIYRQTTENTGTYGPNKKPLISPQTNCATYKIIPSRTSFEPYSFSSKDVQNGSLKHYDPPKANHNRPKFDRKRPFTPPEKRYSATFGLRAPDRKYGASKRPKSSYMYENVYADEFCVPNSANRNNRSLQNLNNFKIGDDFPKPEYKHLYIQERLN